MDAYEPVLLLHGLDYFAQLAQRVCVVVVAASVCIRWGWVRRALRGVETSWRHRGAMALAFGLLSVLGTHSSIVLEVEPGGAHVVAWSAAGVTGLGENQAIVGFRDTMTMVCGLIAGPWVGLGAGLIAGGERYGLGGFAALPSGLGTVALGLLAGWSRRMRPRGAATPGGAAIVALAGLVPHRLLILFLAKSAAQPADWLSPDPLAVALSWEILLPVALVNILGCALFIWVMRDLDRDFLESEANATRLLRQTVELQALRAQIEPEFLNNTLNAIRALIRLDPDLAREYVVKLAGFFHTARHHFNAATVPLREELEQLERYLDFQDLRFAGKFAYQAEIPPALLDCRVPPHSLLGLAENALKYGIRGRTEGFKLCVQAADLGASWVLRAADNGCGIATERLAELGKAPVASAHSQGNGTFLYQLARQLDLIFGGRASLVIDSEPGKGTAVVLGLPKQEAGYDAE